MQRKKDLAAVLKRGEMPIDHVRFIIRTIYNDLNTFAPFLCAAMLNELIKAEIILRGPKWDSSVAPSMMAKHLQQSSKTIENKIDGLISIAHGMLRERRTVWEPQRIVYDYYRHLRFKMDFVVREPIGAKGRELWKEVWRMASQETSVKKELEKSPEEVKNFKDRAMEFARITFRDEIKPLKNKWKARKAEK